MIDSSRMEMVDDLKPEFLLISFLHMYNIWEIPFFSMLEFWGIEIIK